MEQVVVSKSNTTFTENPSNEVNCLNALVENWDEGAGVPYLRSIY